MRFFLIITSFLLMAYGLKYQMRFKNEKNLMVTIDIFDKLSDTIDNPYNFHLTGIAIDPNIIFGIHFNPLPADVVDLKVGYSSDGGATWTDESGPTISPRQKVLPASGTYNWRFTLVFEDDSETIYYIDLIVPQIMNLTPAAPALEEEVIDNDENKFKQIRAKKFTFRFASKHNFQLSNLCREPNEDDRFQVVIDVEGRPIHRGYLLLDDLSEPFLSPRNVVVLTSIDKLGSLKDTDMKTFADENPKGNFRIIEYIAWALRKTGWSLPINVINNIREEHFPNDHWYDKIYLNAKTFETEIGRCEDFYTALNKIFGFNCFVTQERGEWWIKNIDEYDEQVDYVTVFDSDGNFLLNEAPMDNTKTISKSSATFFINKATPVSPVRGKKFARLNYNYQTPQEIVCNIDFSRGALIDGSDPLSQKFDIECWEKLFSNIDTDDPEPNGIYLRRIYGLPGYEKERYVQIEASGSHFRFIMSEPFPVRAKDKLRISVDRRLSSDDGASGFFRDTTVIVRLYGNTGTKYTHHGKTSADPKAYWEITAYNFRPANFHVIEGNVDEDQRESKGLYDGDIAEVPEDGEIRICLYASAIWGPTKDTYIDRCSIEYLPFIAGSYQKYHGQYNKVTQDGNYMAKLEDEVFISDSPANLFKGALMYKEGELFFPAGRFYNAAVFPNALPPDEFFHPFSFIQIFSAWNQDKRTLRVFRAQLKGIDAGNYDVHGRSNAPGLIHKYIIGDKSEHSNQKYFQLLSYKRNWQTGIWTSATLKEVMNRATGKSYDDAWEFKYF